ncbi:MAG: glycerophosphodiester phosphodiesterase [Bacteroides sp.]|nr:glycerophosphodiester phosphodiesterase [Bacteroides sp.]MCM1550794.1 glycerophosphodiester phosphodiesterase [Clostridium sp.]
MNTQIIAHRGASYLANHENTIEAFQIALDIQSDCIELDIRQTLDKTLIVFHDEEFNGIPVKTLTYKELNALSEEAGYRIPTLEEVLFLCQKKMRLLIELKEAGYEKRVLSMVNSIFSYDEYSLQSFLDIVVRRIKKIDANVNTGLLLGAKQADFSTRFNEYYPIRRQKECHADFISAHHMLATPDFILRMKHARIPFYVWTVNEPRAITHFLEAEADGIITNRPDVGIFLRSRHEKEIAAQAEKRSKTFDTIKRLLHPGAGKS